MFEVSPEERMKVFQRRKGVARERGACTGDVLRQYSTPVVISEALLTSFNNPLDFSPHVYCPQCWVSDGVRVTAYPLLALGGDDPMAEHGGKMLTFCCLHCGFEEHHPMPNSELASAFDSEMKRKKVWVQMMQDYEQRDHAMRAARDLNSIGLAQLLNTKL
jgi:hypothetical protein